MFMAAPLRIVGDSRNNVEALEVMQMKGGTFDISGRKRPVETGNTFMIPCDTVVIAIGERTDGGLLEREGIVTNKKGTACVNPHTFQTSNSKIYAAGDVVTGPSTAAEAMGMAKEAAASIDLNLTGEKRFHKLMREFVFDNTPPEDLSAKPKIAGRHLPVEQRKGNFQEINFGFMGDQARKEAMRCLRCDIRIGCSKGGEK